MHKICSKKSNKELVSLLKQADLPIHNGRNNKIDALIIEWEANYRERFENMHGYPLEDTKNPRLFKKHFKRFKRRMKRQEHLLAIKRFINRFKFKKQKP